jgi:hypothetical protein
MVYLLEPRMEESEEKFIKIIELAMITNSFPELSIKRKELGEERLLVIRQIRQAKKENNVNKLEELYLKDIVLGKEIDVIDNIIEEGFKLIEEI